MYNSSTGQNRQSADLSKTVVTFCLFKGKLNSINALDQGEKGFKIAIL